MTIESNGGENPGTAATDGVKRRDDGKVIQKSEFVIVVQILFYFSIFYFVIVVLGLQLIFIWAGFCMGHTDYGPSLVLIETILFIYYFFYYEFSVLRGGHSSCPGTQIARGNYISPYF